jgi:capsular polysaccharide export protein
MHHPPVRRRFLFLQGLAGPFFGRLASALQQSGHGIERVNFHGGDRVFWPLPGAIDYQGRPEDWPDFLATLLAKRQVTDIVLFGDCRPLHRAAIGVSQDLRVQVHVFEEGYIRPDWVTIELGGVNGHSTLPRDPEWYLHAARDLPPYDADGALPSSFRRRALEDLAYNFSQMLLSWRYPHRQTHRPWHPLVEYGGWAWRLSRRKWAKRRAAVMLQHLADEARPYFVFPLQLDCDYQIRLHSPYKGMQPAIEHVLTSFAAHAPADAVLVVKEHPLDNGLINWRKRVTTLAQRMGIAARVRYLEDGDIVPLVQNSRGVVTINSTTGTLALASGVPVITLGQAVYDLHRVTFQGALDTFWADPTPPESQVFDAFRRVLVSRCLVRGGYFSEPALRMLVENSVSRLEQAAPGHAPAAIAAEARTSTFQSAGRGALAAVSSG